MMWRHEGYGLQVQTIIIIYNDLKNITNEYSVLLITTIPSQKMGVQARGEGLAEVLATSAGRPAEAADLANKT